MLCPYPPLLTPLNPLRDLQHYLHSRHTSPFPPCVILVASRHPDDESLHLLSWAIDVASRPRDVVIASLFSSHLGAQGEAERDALNAKLAALKDVCETNEVKLDVRICSEVISASRIIQQATSLQATMLVTHPHYRQGLRYLRTMGNTLAQKVPAGCSVAIVKDRKVLFFKSANAKKHTMDDCPLFSADSSNNSHVTSAEPSTASNNDESNLPTVSHCSTPLLEKREDAEVNPHSRTQASSKSWPPDVGGCSPRGVLDVFELSSESDTSSPSGNHCTLSQSLSRKGLLSCVSSQGDDDDTVIIAKEKRLYFRKKDPMHRSSTFPSSWRLRKCSTPLDCKLTMGSFKSYVNILCSTESMSHDPFAPSALQVDWRPFSYAELAVATDQFNPDNLVGRGGQAEVYMGKLQDGRLVAVKRLRQNCSENIKEKEFLSELGIIGHVSHPNTIALVGFCVEDGLYLIFEYSSHGCLSTMLHGENQPLLDWSIRYKVAIGVARGLHYLHTGCARRIIHRDVKTSNILLDREFEPQISDFGLAKWLPGECTQLNVFPVEGTFGYLAPEYFTYGIVNEKTDVFAFGVLLLELISGRQPIDHRQQSLVMWARPLLESMRIEELVDPRLRGTYDSQQMHNMVIAARLCVQPSAICRPYMDQILNLLLTGESETCCIALQSSPGCQDLCEEGYSSSSNYLSDLTRHREVALQQSEEL